MLQFNAELISLSLFIFSSLQIIYVYIMCQALANSTCHLRPFLLTLIYLDK